MYIPIDKLMPFSFASQSCMNLALKFIFVGDRSRSQPWRSAVILPWRHFHFNRELFARFDIREPPLRRFLCCRKLVQNQFARIYSILAHSNRGESELNQYFDSLKIPRRRTLNLLFASCRNRRWIKTPTWAATVTYEKETEDIKNDERACQRRP